ncbi:MAG: mevalonate kinase [Bacteroidetes bacterium]|nr:MAG: mevalonate kinase [Bacteroidota bacterium]RLD82882.1 MAG: mevalonate kinase [Bacteroidota bacterium]
MTNKQEVFYAKIMLFGEYSVICNSMGLTIPYAHFKGELGFLNKYRYTDHDFAIDSNKMLRAYHTHLLKLQEKGEMKCELNLEHFKKDIDKNLFFESTIPQGFGIGSSGAVCAAIYERYALNKIRSGRNLKQEDVLMLKAIFAQMEGYFHGISSGIDPLNCYLKYPLLINGGSGINVVGIPRNKFPLEGAIFLIDTGKPGITQPLVNLFIEKCQDKVFDTLIKETLIPLNDRCIHSLLEGKTDQFFSSLDELSAFQYAHFRPMIPDSVFGSWKAGLDNKTYSLKLCGSGGGGFILGFTRDFEASQKSLQSQGQKVIAVYKNS